MRLQKENKNIWIFFIKYLPLQPQNRQGTLAEWLGAGLQNRLRRFESARYLIIVLITRCKSAIVMRIFFVED